MVLAIERAELIAHEDTVFHSESIRILGVYPAVIEDLNCPSMCLSPVAPEIPFVDCGGWEELFSIATIFFINERGSAEELNLQFPQPKTWPELKSLEGASVWLRSNYRTLQLFTKNTDFIAIQSRVTRFT